jgi:predicted dehydrogenase
MIGWEDSFLHELLHFLTAIREDADVAPHGATFEDGYRCAEICDAIVRASETGQRQRIEYRSL